MDTVNIFSKDLRNIVRKDLISIPGAWVEFYDDITAGEIKKAQQAQETKDVTSSFEMIIGQIADWNFADETTTILPINTETFDKLSLKVVKELADLQTEVLTVQQDKKKE